MKITDNKKECPECKKHYCKHYESDFDRYLIDNYPKYKVIVIGDPHGRDNWKEIIKYAGEFDKVVFIGDYFDSFDLDAKTQMDNFKEIVAYKKAYPEKVVLLYGNHDLHYLIPTEQYSGYQPRYQYMIETLLRDAQSLLQVAFEADNVLYTHAGVTKTWVSDFGIDMENLVDSMNNAPMSIYGFVSRGDYHRGGDDVFQSPMWVRPQSLEKDMIDNYTQVIGHTEQYSITSMCSGNITIVDSPNSNEYLEVLGMDKTIINYK